MDSLIKKKAGHPRPALESDKRLIFILDRDWRIESCSQPLPSPFGQGKEAEGTECERFFETILGQRFQGLKEIIRERVEKGLAVGEIETEIAPVEGSDHRLVMHVIPLFYKDGSLRGAGVLLTSPFHGRHISRLVLDSIADGVFTVDKNWRITSFNKSAEALTGWKAQEVVGRQCRDIFRSSVCGHGCILAQSIEEDLPIVNKAIFIRKKNGSILPISISASPLFNAAGEIIGGVETFRDITESIEKELILESISEGVFTVDADFNITSFNKAAQAITGYTQEEAVGKSCHEVFQSDLCGTECPIALSMEEGAPTGERTVYIRTKHGKKVPIAVNAAPLTDHQGNIIGGVETFRDMSEVLQLRKRLSDRFTFEDIISKNAQMQRIFAILPDISKSDSNVLILGESGTGKELIARAIHNLSNRRNGPFVAVNCGAIPDTLLESELFGYKAGAFTDAKRDKAGKFAAAQGGTLFLDEIGDISAALQVKLLRVLQDKTYEPLGSNKAVKADIRILAATNRDLEQQVKEGTFREDLYYRLNVVKILLPPLRERLEDLPLLVNHFIHKFNVEKGRNVTGISQEALALLMRHDYPGNIRELENIIEYAFILCHTGEIRAEHLPEPFSTKKAAEQKKGLYNFTSPMSLEEIEKQAIYQALERNKWKKMATCRELGISKDTLRRKIRKYGLKRRFPGAVLEE